MRPSGDDTGPWPFVTIRQVPDSLWHSTTFHGDRFGEMHHVRAEDRLPIRRPPWSPDRSCQFSFLTAPEPSHEGSVRPLIHNGLRLWIELHPCVPRPLSHFGGLSAVRRHPAERHLWENLSEEQRVSSGRRARHQIALSLRLCDLGRLLELSSELVADP